MATDRQIAANRSNARNSPGPRSASGKKRASQNALRHGLTKPILGAEFDSQVETLARQIAGEAEDIITLEHARAAAQAILDLARVRQVKVSLVKIVSTLGALGAPPSMDIGSFVKAWLYVELASEGRPPRGRPPRMPEPIDPLRAMPSEEPERTAEAVRRILPELFKLHRYEARGDAKRPGNSRYSFDGYKIIVQFMIEKTAGFCKTNPIFRCTYRCLCFEPSSNSGVKRMLCFRMSHSRTGRLAAAGL